MRSRFRFRPGQSLVEFALALPLLIMLMLGTIDLARAFYTKVTLANASRAAAEVGVNWFLVEQVGAAEATTRVQQRGDAEAGPYADVTLSDVTLEHFDGASWAPGLTWQQGQRFRVTVTARFTPLTPLIQQFVGGSVLTMSHMTEMRHTCSPTSTACSTTY